ncbi:putative T7SS-secreted protein [Streptomyces sp. NPDC020096]
MSGFMDEVNHLGDSAEHFLDKGKKFVGGAVDHVAHGVADGLNWVGWHSAAHDVDGLGDRFADSLGASVPEMGLDEAKAASDLIHGNPKTIRDSAEVLSKFAGAFRETGEGLRRLDPQHWKGQAGDAFRRKFAPHPKEWLTAADACDLAGKTLVNFAHTVEWAQEQARQALEMYSAAKKKSEDARTAYNQQVDKYNASSGAGTDAAHAPEKPGPFHDPGEAGMKAAQEILDEARRQRDVEGDAATAKVSAATEMAPKTPTFAHRMAGDYEDVMLAGGLTYEHVGMGFLGAGADFLKFVRSVNPTDPYNLTHPAMWLAHTNDVAAGLLHAGNHPVDLVKSVVGTGWSSDPGDAGGQLLFNVLSAVGTDGASTPETVTTDVAENLSQDVAKTEQRAAESARDGAHDPAESSRGDGDKTECGDPVDIATGVVSMRQTDVQLPGALPLSIRRTHLSSYRAGRWFGTSWASTLDQRLEIDDEGLVYAGSDGMLLAYPVPRQGTPVLPVTGPRWPLTWDGSPGGAVRISMPELGQTLEFAPCAAAPAGTRNAISLPVRTIEDRNGHRIDFTYGKDGAPQEITHSGGYRIAVDTEASRVTALRLLHTDGTDTLLMRYGYDAAGDLTEVTNSSARPLRYGFDADGRLTSWADRNGTSFTYTYDEHGRCVRTDGSDGFMSGRMEYDGEARTTVYTNSLGQTTTYRYNASYKLTAETNPLGHTTYKEWDAEGRLLLAETNPLGHVMRYTYDAEENLTAIHLPDGHEVRAAYNPLGQPVEVIEPGGAVWRHTYDDRGNRLTTVDPAGAATRYAYDDSGHLATVTDALGNTEHITCDAAGLPIAITDSLGNTTTFRRDGFGRIGEITDPLGHTTRMGWTTEGKPKWREQPDGARESWEWDGEGNLLSHTDPAGNTTRHTSTHFDLTASRTDPDGTVYDFAYDTELRLTGVTNPQGLTWSYEYDAAGRLVAETDFNGRTLSYAHDAAGQLLSRTNGAGETLTFTRDVLGRTTATATDEGTETTFAYDVAGHPLRAANADAEVVWQRDALGRVLTETTNGRTVTYAYDAIGRRTQRTTPGGAVSHWTYDAAGRPTQLRTDSGSLDFTYDAAGREIERRLGEAVRLTQAWDSADRLTVQSVTHRPSGEEVLLQHRTYAYRADGLLTEIRELTAGTRRFTLNKSGRVTAVTAHGWTETYAYDEAGNLTSAEAPAHPAAGDREFTGTLIHRAGRTHYEHDAQGRLTRKTSKLLNGQTRTWSFAWNAEDRLTDAVTPEGERWQYAYDPLGRRIAKRRLAQDGSVTEETTFTWDDTRLAEQTAADGHTTTWDYAPGTHRPLAQSDRATPAAPGSLIARLGEPAHFHAVITDATGTPTELLTPDGEITWQARTTLWGTRLPAPAPDSDVNCPLRFPGQYHDPETGLNYNYFRYYDPETARYATPDPLGLEPADNHHAYVVDPLSWTDPLGLSPCPRTAQAAKLRDFYEQAEKYGKGGIRELDSGRIRFYGEVSPARTPGVMIGRRLVREWDPDTGAKRVWHETLDSNGNVRIVRPDVNVTNGVKVHYRFDENGNFEGTF